MPKEEAIIPQIDQKNGDTKKFTLNPNFLIATMPIAADNATKSPQIVPTI